MKSIEKFIQKANIRHNYKYDYSKSIYVNNRKKIIIICPIHGEFLQIPTNHLKGCGCPKCNKGLKSTLEEFIQEANRVHNYKYDYSKSIYVNARTKIIIICPEHGEFKQTPDSHLQGCGCPKCYGRIKFSIEEYIKKARKRHGDKFNYDKFVYINAHTKGIVICPEHGEFSLMADSHLRGITCPKCSGRTQWNTETIVKEFKKNKGDKYDYSEFIYKNSRTKGIIICPKHGKFLQRPDIHLSGCGCLKCANETMNYDKRDTWENFTNEAHIVHNNKYDYSKFIYKNRRTKGIIICPKHGEFLQNPGVHLSGKGCPVCGKNVGISKVCKEWLDGFDNPNILREEPLIIGNKKFIPDGYDPKTNTIYECNGDFWHGNPEVFDLNKLNPILKITFGELYRRTLEKEKIYKENGFNVVSIWENDYKKMKNKK